MAVTNKEEMKFSLKGIIAVSGKPGLYKVIAQGKNNLIVESLIDKKRMPAYSSNKISTLEDISMYTTEEDMPLAEIVQKIYEKENGGTMADAKDESKHAGYFESIVPNYDKERVYSSDIKKLFSWYNLLQSSGELARIAEDAKKAEEAEEGNKEEKKAKKTKKAEAEPKEEKEAVAEKKKPAAKKAATVKTKTAKPGDVKIKTDSKAKSTVRKSGGAKRGS